MEIKDTLLFPKTGFEMRGNLTQKEPVMIKKWQDQELYQKMNENREGCEEYLLHEKELANPEDEIRPGLVHRIDKDTSGLLCIAKTDLAFESLSKQLADHSMHREYYALVKGTIYENDGKIDAPIGRDPNHPTKFAVDPKKGKEAVTYFHGTDGETQTFNCPFTR